ncbi:hypothetical protein [Gordonia malaquae]|uniref:hypothetical protein n=1 Tax=Gordonia malaquae TaxID=410332 RepID=UPI0030FEB77C
MSTTAVISPASRPPASWQSRFAALKSRGATDDDPRIVECHAALAYWRCRRVIDVEVGHLTPADADALAELLRTPTDSRSKATTT